MDENIRVMDAIQFQHTQTTLKKIVSDFKRLCNIGSIFLFLVMTFYYIYCIFLNLANYILLSINIVMLFLTTLSFVILRVYVAKDKRNKKIKSNIKHMFNLFKFIIRGFAIGFAIYEIFILPSPHKMIITLVMLVILVLQILLEVVTLIVEHYVDMFVSSLQCDIKDIKLSINYDDTKTLKENILGNVGKNVVKEIGKGIGGSFLSGGKNLLSHLIPSRKSQKIESDIIIDNDNKKVG